MSSDFEKLRTQLILFILKQRNRQRIASLSGLHINTVSDVVNGNRNARFSTLVALETACNHIKANQSSFPTDETD